MDNCHSLLDSVLYYWTTESKNRNKFIYEAFEKNTNTDLQLLDSFNQLEGCGEVPFSWNWKLLVDEMPLNFRYLEIGVYKGRVLAQVGMLAKRSRKNAILVGITPLASVGDQYSNYEDIDYKAAIEKNYIHVGNKLDNLHIIKGFSQESTVIQESEKRGPFDIIFIDGCHDYDIVVKDIYNYTPLLKHGGFLVMDDASLYIDYPHGIFLGHPDVSRAVKEHIDGNDSFLPIYNIGHNRVWRKKSVN
jgi:hypothetical protein